MNEKRSGREINVGNIHEYLYKSHHECSFFSQCNFGFLEKEKRKPSVSASWDPLGFLQIPKTLLVEQLISSGHQTKRVALFPKTKGSSRVSNFGQEPSRDSKGPLMCLHDAESQGLGLSR